MKLILQGGKVKRVCVYLSEHGKEKMKNNADELGTGEGEDFEVKEDEDDGRSLVIC